MAKNLSQDIAGIALAGQGARCKEERRGILKENMERSNDAAYGALPG